MRKGRKGKPRKARSWSMTKRQADRDHRRNMKQVEKKKMAAWNNEQKVCPEKVRAKLDPFHRDDDGIATAPRASGMSPKFAAMLEFLIQVPLPTRTVQPAIQSLCTTSDHFLIGNGDFLGSSDDLERNLRDWCNAVELTEIERTSFQSMIERNMGVPTACHRVTL